MSTLQGLACDVYLQNAVQNDVKFGDERFKFDKFLPIDPAICLYADAYLICTIGNKSTDIMSL